MKLYYVRKYYIVLYHIIREYYVCHFHSELYNIEWEKVFNPKEEEKKLASNTNI